MEGAHLVVGGERERQDRFAEGRDGPGEEAGQGHELVRRGEAKLFRPQGLACELGRQLAGSGNDEEMKAVVGLDHEGLGPAFERFTAFARGILRRERGGVMNLPERDPGGGEVPEEPGVNGVVAHGSLAGGKFAGRLAG